MYILNIQCKLKNTLRQLVTLTLVFKAFWTSGLVLVCFLSIQKGKFTCLRQYYIICWSEVSMLFFQHTYMFGTVTSLNCLRVSETSHGSSVFMRLRKPSFFMTLWVQISLHIKTTALVIFCACSEFAGNTGCPLHVKRWICRFYESILKV